MIGRSLDIAAALALAAAPPACAKAPEPAAQTTLAAARAAAPQNAGEGGGMVIPASASAFDGCSAEDAPAIMIALTGAVSGAPEIMIEIAALDPASLPVTITLSPLRRADPAARPIARASVERNGEAAFLEGAIVIETMERGTRITGTYRMTMPDGAGAAGAFDAAWKAQAPAM